MTTEREADIDELPAAEQRLLDSVEAMAPGRAACDELSLSLARLRNLHQKYTERAKRARLEARAGRPVESAATLSRWLARIESAQRHARHCLAAVQEPGSSGASVGEDGD